MKRIWGALVLAGCIAGSFFVRATPSPAQEWVDEYEVYDATKLTGSWTMATEVELTTCSSTPPGTKKSKTWDLTFSDDLVQIKSSSGIKLTGNQPERYKKKDKFLMTVRPPRESLALYEFKMDDKSGKSFTGRVIISDGCATLSRVTLTKQ